MIAEAKCAMYHKRVNSGPDRPICSQQCPSCLIWYGRDEPKPTPQVTNDAGKDRRRRRS